MAQVTIKVYRNNNHKSSGFKKYYGRVKHTTEISARTLCEHAALDSGIEQALVAIIFDAVAKQIKEQLCNGHPIKLEGIGTFKVGVSSTGWSAEDVMRMFPQYDPTKDDIRKYLSARQVKKAHLLFTPTDELKSMLRGVKLVTDKTEWESLIEEEKNS